MEYEQLLYYYQQELSYIRQLGKQFAASHPGIAGRLQSESKDPFVACLSDAFALANARLREMLEQESRDIQTQWNTLLYPQQQQLIPSATIVQFEPSANLTGCTEIPAGSMLESPVILQQSCLFKTCYPIQLAPIQMVSTGFIAASTSNHSCLKVSLKTGLLTEVQHLRFYINAGLQDAYSLRELLFAGCLRLTVSSSGESVAPITIGKEALSTVGFLPEESLLPHNKRSFLGYQILQDFFVFPEKFLFFTLNYPLDTVAQKIKPEETLDIYFHFNQHHPILEKNLNHPCLALHCSPAVNLFELYSEPFSLSKTQTDYPLIPHAAVPEQIEIHQVKRVVALGHDFAQDCLPLYHFNSSGIVPDYQVIRRPSNEENESSSVYLRFTSAQIQPVTMYAELVCTNRNLPEQFPYGGHNTQLKLQTAHSEVSLIRCLTPMSAARYQNDNKLPLYSLAEHHSSLNTLRGILKAFDFHQSGEQQNLATALLAISSKKATLNLSSGRAIMGTEITVTVDDNKFSGSNLYLFGQVLHRVFAHLRRLNSFTVLNICNRQQNLYCYEEQRN